MDYAVTLKCDCAVQYMSLVDAVTLLTKEAQAAEALPQLTMPPTLTHPTIHVPGHIRLVRYLADHSRSHACC